MRLATAYRLVGDDLLSKVSARRAEIQQHLAALDAELRQLVFEQTMQRIAACDDGDEAMRIAKEALSSLRPANAEGSLTPTEKGTDDG